MIFTCWQGCHLTFLFDTELNSSDIHQRQIQVISSVKLKLPDLWPSDRPGFGFSSSFLQLWSLGCYSTQVIISGFNKEGKKNNVFVNASRREWLPSRQYRENSEMTNENPVVSAVTGFDDDKLIHKSKLVFNTVLNGPFNRSIFIVCRASALLSRGVSFSPTVEIIHREKRIFSAVRRGKKKSNE